MDEDGKAEETAIDLPPPPFVNSNLEYLNVICEFDEGTLRQAVKDAIAANHQALDDFKKGKTAAANRIKGHVMKSNKGAPNDVVGALSQLPKTEFNSQEELIDAYPQIPG